MKRKPLAAMTTLAALPAVIIAITAMNSSASTPAARTIATSYARLADSGNSGLDVLGGASDCHTIGVWGKNPNPGEDATITVSANGVTSSVISTNAVVTQRFSSMTPSTTYTVTMNAGSSWYTFDVTTPAC
jgi:hypothetical protein